MSRSKESEWRHFGIAAALTVIGFLVMATGCASAPRYSPDDTYIDINNDGYSDVVVSINGQRFSLVTGKSHAPLFLSRWRLDGGRCAFVTVHQIAGGSVSTTRECLRPDEHLELYVGSLLSTTNLVPRPPKP